MAKKRHVPVAPPRPAKGSAVETALQAARDAGDYRHLGQLLQASSTASSADLALLGQDPQAWAVAAGAWLLYALAWTWALAAS